MLRRIRALLFAGLTLSVASVPALHAQTVGEVGSTGLATTSRSTR